jgi:hypothetical protein
MIEAFFLRAASRLVPERFQRFIAWMLAGFALLVLVAALVAAVWAGTKLWLHFHDAKVVEQHEDARQAAATDATVKSAEKRSADAIQGLVVEQARETAIAKAEASEAARPIEQRAILPPTTIALNCARLLHAYSSTELAKMPAYQEHCR